MNRHLKVYRGLPASGKSTAAKQEISVFADMGINAVRIERDDIRLQILGSYYTGKHEDELEVTKVQHDRIIASLNMGMVVISSDTNLPDRRVRELQGLAESVGAPHSVSDFRHVSLETCLERNANRERKVPEKVIRDMYEKHIRGKDLDKPLAAPIVSAVKRNKTLDFEAVEKYKAPEGGVPTLLLDIDGTVANHEGIRDPYDTSKYRDDLPHLDVIELVKHLNGVYDVVVFSGRHVDFKEDLEFWLAKHDVPYSRIIMREREQVPDYEEKVYLFDKYIRNDDNVKVIGVFDDRDQVVKAWRHGLGIRCYQVNYGDF